MRRTARLLGGIFVTAVLAGCDTTSTSPPADAPAPQFDIGGAPEVIGVIRQDCTGVSNCFNSLAAWESAYGGINFGSCAPGNLVCAGVSAVAQIEGSWTSADAGAVAISGWTTDATHVIRIHAAAGARHSGAWDDTRYRLAANPGSDNSPVLLIDAGHVIIDGLQIANTRASSWGNPGVNTGAVASLTFSNNIVRKLPATNQYNNYGINLAGGTTTGRHLRVVNNVIIGYFRALALQSHNNDVIVAHSNTIVGLANSTNSYGISALGGGSSDVLHLRNNLVQASVGAAAAYEVLPTRWSSASIGHNISHDATSPDAAYRHTLVTFANPAGLDYHLAPSDAAARDRGADLSADPGFAFNADIDGQTRSGGWDIGADESGGGPPPVDTTPPVRSSGTPTGTLPYGTTQTTIALVTQESATCRYAAGTGIDYASMTLTFSATGTTGHSTSVGGLQDGQTYSFYVRCQDASGNANADDYVISFAVASPPAPDVTAPSVPAGLAATVVSASRIDLTWSPSADNAGGSGVAGYRLFRDGVQIAQQAGTVYQDAGLTAATQYAYTVLAYDHAGNASASSAAVLATTHAPPPPPPPPGSAIIADHRAVQAFPSIPVSVLNNVKTMVLLNIGQSHGLQIPHGLDNLEAQNGLYAATVTNYDVWPTQPNGTLRVARGLDRVGGNMINYVTIDQFWNTASGLNNVRLTLNNYAAQGVKIDAILHTWSWHLGTWTSAQLQTYFTNLSQLESEYPHIKFIYMTDVEDRGGAEGYNRHLRNEEIRAWVRANGKILFDFGGLETWNRAGTAQNTYLYNGVQVPRLHPEWDVAPYYTAGHTSEDVTTMKAKAMWWLLARLSGWAG